MYDLSDSTLMLLGNKTVKVLLKIDFENYLWFWKNKFVVGWVLVSKKYWVFSVIFERLVFEGLKLNFRGVMSQQRKAHSS